MRMIHGVLLAAFTGLFLLASPAFAGGKKLPADIQADINKRFPGAKVLGFGDEAKKHIEVQIQLKSGTKVEVIYATKTVTVTKHVFAAEEIVVKDLPIAVVNGVEKKLPGAVIKKAERVIDAKGKIILFQVLVTKKGGGSVELHVTPAGALVNEFNVISQAPTAPARLELASVIGRQ